MNDEMLSCFNLAENLLVYQDRINERDIPCIIPVHFV
jgi:hypothetical protein